LRWFHTLFVNPVFHLVTLVVGVLLLRLVMRASRHTGRLLARTGREGDIPRLKTNKLVSTGRLWLYAPPLALWVAFLPQVATLA
jgi:hypothetical protein